MALGCGRTLGRGRVHRRLRTCHVVDVGGDGDVVAPVCGDVVRHVRGERAELLRPLILALEPSFDIDDPVPKANATLPPVRGALTTGAERILPPRRIASCFSSALPVTSPSLLASALSS